MHYCPTPFTEIVFVFVNQRKKSMLWREANTKYTHSASRALRVIRSADSINLQQQPRPWWILLFQLPHQEATDRSLYAPLIILDWQSILFYPSYCERAQDLKYSPPTNCFPLISRLCCGIKSYRHLLVCFKWQWTSYLFQLYDCRIKNGALVDVQIQGPGAQQRFNTWNCWSLLDRYSRITVQVSTTE